MDKLYFSGKDTVDFALTLLLTQIIFWTLMKFIKSDHIKAKLPAWYNVILSVMLFITGNFFWYVSDVRTLAIFLFIITLTITLLGFKFKAIVDKNISNWAVGITLIIAGILIIYNYSVNLYLEFIVIGILWLLATIKWPSYKLGKLSSKSILGIVTLVLGIFCAVLGSYYYDETAHIQTDNYSVTLGKQSAWVSGYATPNSKIHTYLDGKEETPAEKSDADGYFEFEVNVPGKWTVKVTKDGKTVSDYTIVKKSAAWKKHQAKIEAKEAKNNFMDYYADAYEALDNVGVDEYNTWLDENSNGEGGYIDDTLDAVQNQDKKDVQDAVADIILIQASLEKIKNADDSDYAAYHQYYSDIKRLQSVVINPPAGDIDNFGNLFEEYRTNVDNNLTEMGNQPCFYVALLQLNSF